MSYLNQPFTQPKPVITADGSVTLALLDSNEHYHSTHGALQESLHVYIRNGLQLLNTERVHILEIGLGTGLNCMLTYAELQHSEQLKTVDYTAIEPFPIDFSLVNQLNYHQWVETTNAADFLMSLHTNLPCNNAKIAENFIYSGLVTTVEKYEIIKDKFDLIYFDAFGPRTQPEMWTKEIFEKMYLGLKTGGMLVTYCAKGEVKRIMKSLGFKVESALGPIGKREMTRAIKN